MTEAEWLTATDPTKGQVNARKLRLFAYAKATLLGGKCEEREIVQILTEDSVQAEIDACISTEGFAGSDYLDELFNKREMIRSKAMEPWPGTSLIRSYLVGTYYNRLHPDHGALVRVGTRVEPDSEVGVIVAMNVANNVISECHGVVLEIYAKHDSFVDYDTPLFRIIPTLSAEGNVQQEAQISALFRDIFGNLFRPVTLDPSWLTSTVLVLANGIYSDKAFDRLPILADALQDAGCDNDDILNHLREPGEHCRGCWALDLVLGRD
jgi:biotin carboxyl carrier protein